jgi:hypothetical protein
MSAGGFAHPPYNEREGRMSRAAAIRCVGLTARDRRIRHIVGAQAHYVGFP